VRVGAVFALSDRVLSPYRVNHRPMNKRAIEPAPSDGIILLLLVLVLLLAYKFS